MYEEIKTINLLDLNRTIAKDLLEKYLYAFEALTSLKEYTKSLGSTLSLDEYDLASDEVWISKDAKIYSNSTIEGPTIIGSQTEIRPGAWIRGGVIIGKKCVVGNSTEIKNSILFDEAKVPHYNYIGDSILGYKSHFGAGTITSNVKSDKSNVTIKINGEVLETNLYKFGAIVGDCVEIGCQAVLNPGTVIGRNSTIYPLTSVRGYVEPQTILKLVQTQQIKVKSNKN